MLANKSGLVVEFLDLSLIVVDVETDVVGEITDTVAPCQVKFPTVRRKVGDVLKRCRCTHNARYLDAVGKHSVGAALVVVECHLQTVVQRRNVNTEVDGLHGLPCEAAADESRRRDYVDLVVLVEPYGAWADGHGRKELIRIDVLVADRTVAGAQFDVVEPCARPFHKLLLSQTPAY